MPTIFNLMAKTMKNLSYLCAFVCLLMVPAGPAETAQFEFTPSLSVGGEFSDNHFLSEINQEDEFITTVSPFFSGKVITKLHGLEIIYNPTYAAYSNYDENNMLRQQASTKGWLTLGKNTRLEIGDSFSLTEDPLSEADVVGADVDNPDVAIDTTLRSSRKSHYSNSAKINFSHQFGASDSLTVTYVQSILENEDPAIEDNSKHNPSVGVTFWPVPKKSVRNETFLYKGRLFRGYR